MLDSSIDESESDAETQDESSKKRRRGVRNDDNYSRNAIKKAKVKGAEHKNHVGKTVPAKTVGEDCR